MKCRREKNYSKKRNQKKKKEPLKSVTLESLQLPTTTTTAKRHLNR